MTGIAFYDRYHQKNRRYAKVISRPNFTYFYVLETLHQICLPLLDKRKKLNAKKPVVALDVGCGVGTMSLYLASRLGWQVKGVDISQRAIEICQQAKQALSLKNVQFTRGELKTGRPYFDFVICLEVVEHLKDDRKFLKQIATQLRQGGILFLSTPSSENFLYKHGYYQKFDKEVGHFRRYTPATLRQLLQTSGFRIVFMKSTESPLRNLLFTTRLGYLIYLIKGPLIPAFHWVDRALVKIFGASDILVVVEKA